MPAAAFKAGTPGLPQRPLALVIERECSVWEDAPYAYGAPTPLVSMK